MANLLHPPEIRRRNQYNRSLLYDALKCVLRGKMNCHQASIRFKVPRSTIQRKLNLCREQHRLALELKLQKEGPSSCDENPTESLHEELCGIDTCKCSNAPTSMNSLLLRNGEIYEPLSMHCPEDSKERKSDASMYHVGSIGADSSIGIEHLHKITGARCESVVEHASVDNTIDAAALDEYSADQIDFCGEEHVIGDDLPTTTDGISVTVDDGTIRVIDVSTNIPQVACNCAAVLYDSDASTPTVDESFIGTNFVASGNEYANVVDAIYANQMHTDDEVVCDEYVGVDELGGIVAPQQFITDLQLRFVREEGKLPKYLYGSSSQRAYTSENYELVKPSSSRVIMPAEFIVLRRSQPLQFQNYVYVGEQQEVQGMVVVENVDFAAQRT